MELHLQAGGGAFGDGRHPSTQGMLAALEAIDPSVFTPTNALDMGAGSGILSIAVARQFQCPVLAVDISAQAIETLQQNARVNGVDKHVEGISADGFKHPAISTRAPYDLILMNILAEPLVTMAADASVFLAPGGLLLMAGLMRWQEPAIIVAYQLLNLELLHRLTLGDWVTLVWGRPA